MEQELKLKQISRRDLKYDKAITKAINDTGLLAENRLLIQKYTKYMERSGIKIRSRRQEIHHLTKITKHLKKSFLTMRKSDLVNYVRYLKETGIEYKKGHKPMKDVTIRNRLAILKAFMTWLKDYMIQETTEKYDVKIEQEQNKEIRKKIRTERNELILEYQANFLQLFPKGLYKELNLRIKSIEEYDRFKEDELITAEDVEDMLNVALNSRDKCIVMMFWLTGGRAHELEGDLLKLKDCVKEGDIWLLHISPETKTGQRWVDMDKSVNPYIENWINNHPFKDNPESPLFISLGKNSFGKPLGYQGLKQVIVDTMSRAKINKPFLCHLFRHSAVTSAKQSGRYTDDELKLRFGWSKNSSMINRYTHVDSLTLARRKSGIIKKKVEKLLNKKCCSCGKMGASSNVYCECGGILLDVDQQKKEEDKNLLVKLFEELTKNENGKEILKEALRKVNN